MKMVRALSAILSIALIGWGVSVSADTPPTEQNRDQPSSQPIPGIDGEVYRLDQWRGKVVLLNFWASWCAPCQYEIPTLVRLQEEYAEQGLQVVGVGIDDVRPLANVARSLAINYPVLIAPQQRGERLLRQWGSNNGIIPFNVVLDRSGTPVFEHTGMVNQELFDEYVAPLIAEKQR